MKTLKENLTRLLNVLSGPRDAQADAWRAHFEHNLGLSERASESIIRKTRAAVVHDLDISAVRVIVSKTLRERRMSIEQCLALAIMAPDLFPHTRPNQPVRPSSTPDAVRAMCFFEALGIEKNELPVSRHAVA